MKTLVTNCLITIRTAITPPCQEKPNHWQAQATDVDSLFSSIDTQSQPGCSAGIIKMFLKDKPLKMDFQLASATADWQKFWRKVGAEGDYSAALNEWNIRHNA